MNRCWALIGFGSCLLPVAICAQTTAEYEVRADRSQVRWLVYKAGAFARFGHNHVISTKALSGVIRVSDDITATEWDLGMTVADLVIDDPDLRALEGEEFSSEPTDEDIAGTRTNMLSETVLNGTQFPVIAIAGHGFAGTLADARVNVTIEILGRSIELTLPSEIVMEGDGLTATGAFSLIHEDLGMEPFSVMMGALQVGEKMDFTYHIHATRVNR